MASQPVSPDPMIQTPPADTRADDFEAHVRTYNRFMSLLTWFTIHLAILLVGLYFVVIAGDGMFGAFLILLAIATLVYGFLRNPNARRDVEAAATGGPMSE